MLNWLKSLKSKNWLTNEILVKNKCKLVLDVAHGDGILGKYNIERYSLIGIDLDCSQREGYKKCYAINLDKDCFKFKNESFDAVVLNAILEHLIDFRKCFNESLRVLKKEGLMIVSVPNPQSLYRCLIEWDDSSFLPLTVPSLIHYHYGSLKGWSEYFISKGLLIEKIISLGYLKWPKKLAYNLMWVLKK